MTRRCWQQLTAVKKANKEALADWLLRTQKVSVNPMQCSISSPSACTSTSASS